MVESSAKHSSDFDNYRDGVVSHMNKNPLKFHLQKISLELTCPLCLEFFNRPTLLPCNHIFYNTCVPNRTNFGAECPLCNIQVPGQALIRTNLAYSIASGVSEICLLGSSRSCCGISI